MTASTRLLSCVAKGAPIAARPPRPLRLLVQMKIMSAQPALGFTGPSSNPSGAGN